MGHSLDGGQLLGQETIEAGRSATGKPVGHEIAGFDPEALAAAQAKALGG